MSENLANYTRALDGFDRVIRGVPDDRWKSPSPCTEWKAIDVAGHVIGVQQMLAAGLRNESQGGGRPTPRETAGDDPVAAWSAAKADLLGAASVEGALEAPMKTPFGEMPVDSFMGILVLDALTHTWDLARATGQSDRLDPELVHSSFERIKPLDAAIRAPGFFQPAKPAPDGADEQTELMAFLGRQV
jgi:uncharacterized protein (TIGR03086 family)